MKHKKQLFLKTKDFLVTQESFDLYYDDTLKMLVTSPQPKEEDLPRYYESDAYISHSDTTKGWLAGIYRLVKSYSLRKKVALINKLQQNGGKLLDIGCGTGAFLKKAEKSKWYCVGVEPNQGARTLAENKGLLIYNSLDTLDDFQFDVITLWHVLEHLPSLEQTLNKIVKLLKPNGVLIIAVPNYKSFDANYYKQYWAAYDVPRHLWHFSQDSMKVLFSKKLKFIKTKPMLFDSFYVSLLSEKYKTGKNFSIKAFFVGLYSNSKAWRTTEYSSLIYCFRKQENSK